MTVDDQTQEAAEASFFRDHPDPMWVRDLDGLRFLEVNEAAIRRYGYSRDEFLAMTVLDIRPPEDRDRLTAALRLSTDGLDDHGVWRHLTKTGELLYADVRARNIRFRGELARLVAVRDVTAVVAMERERDAALARERASREAAEAAARQYRALFDAAPGKLAVLRPPDFTVAVVSDAFLDAVGIARARLEGRPLGQVLACELGTDAADAIGNLEASLSAVLTTGRTDAVEHRPYPSRHSRPGETRRRSWLNTPVRGADGRIAFVVHRVLDVADPTAADPVARTLEPELHPELDIVLRLHELREANERLRRRDTMLRSAHRVARMGSWELDLDSLALTCSDEVQAMFGAPTDADLTTQERYLAYLHPDDRTDAARAQDRAIAHGRPFDVVYRIVRSDGAVRMMQETAELVVSDGRRTLVGMVQDVTDEVAARRRAEAATELLRIAGKAARLGGWRIQRGAERPEWTGGTAAILETDSSRPPTLTALIERFAPEHRSVLRDAIADGLAAGTPFDHLLEIENQRGERRWIRAIGEAERDRYGTVVAVRGAFQDVSELIAVRLEKEALASRLHDTLESISDAFVVIDPDWRFRFVNNEASRVLRRRRDELIGANVWDTFGELVGTVFETEYRKAVATGLPVDFAAFYAPLARWFAVKAYPTGDGLAIYFQDVTLTRRQEEQVRLLEAAVARLNDMVVITEATPLDAPDGPRIVYVNDAFLRRTGYRADEVVGRTPRMLQGPDTPAEERARIGRALRAREPVQAELVNYTKAGEPYWIALDVVPLADDAGEVTHFVAVERDITEQRLADAALRASEERFRLVAQATDDVVRDCDLVTGDVWWNDRLHGSLGHHPTAIPPGATGWLALLHPEDEPRVAAVYAAAIAGNRERWSVEYRCRRDDGDYAVVLERGFVLRDATGRPIRLIGSMIDLSQRRQVDERLRHAQKLEAVGYLTGGIAHDFNNLLTVILGNAEMLADGVEDAALRPLAEMTVTAAERGAELTSRLLAFARRQALQPRTVQIDDLLVGMHGLLRRTLPESIDIRMVGTADQWPALVDPNQLETAILNLAINARDAMPTGGALIVETRNAVLDADYGRATEDVEPGPYVEVAVSDTGTGMSAEVVAHAFDPFFTTKEVGKGSGLGLPMVYGFVRQSGGHVRIYSELGEGTTIKLYLPRADTGADTSPKPPPATGVAGGSEHVLVVEDDALVRRHVTELLRGLGYRVTEAAAGGEALAVLAEAADVALLFTDVVMPGGINGAELAREAQRRRPGLRVLFTSGYSENAIVHHGRLDPGVQLLTKPYRRQDLAAKLREVLGAG